MKDSFSYNLFTSDQVLPQELCRAMELNGGGEQLGAKGSLQLIDCSKIQRSAQPDDAKAHRKRLFRPENLRPDNEML